MAKQNAQILFTQQQFEQLEDLKPQTGLNPPSPYGERSTISFSKSGSTDIKSTLNLLPTLGTKEAR